jgi:hypothetical protein
MILQDVLCSIKDAVIGSGLVNKFYEYCEQIRRDERTFPAYYIGGGENIQVQDFEVNGAGYIRKRGGVPINDSPLPSVTACDDITLLQITYPMRMVLGVPKSKLDDSPFSDDRLFYEILPILDADYTATRVQSVDLNVRSYETDSLTIWSQEVKGFDYQMHFRLSYIAIDFDIVFTVQSDCIREVCYGY